MRPEKVERRPGRRDGARNTTTASRLTIPDQAEVAELLVLSAERDAWLRRVLRTERAAYGRGHAAGYELGFVDGILSHKRAQHDAYRLLQLEVARWGPGGREHFGDARPGDYQGGALPAEMPGMVWLGGPAVHCHACAPACRSYRPGFYAPDDAARILQSLPGDAGGAG